MILLNPMPLWLSSSIDVSLVDPNDDLKYFETVPPADYALWDSTIFKMASIIKDWDLDPYYEIWNEPDLYFWNGTEDELLELYIHTANAIKLADPTAKVGGLGCNGWPNNVDWTLPPYFGFIPDSIANSQSITSHLIDTCAATGTPLDFISWHDFGAYWQTIHWASNYFDEKLESYGMTDVEKIITEYNMNNSPRETLRQSSFIVPGFQTFADVQIDGHTFSSFQDFVYDETDEFHGEWGSISRGGLAKPVYMTTALIDYVQSNGEIIDVEMPNNVTAIASIEADTLRILLSNHTWDPANAGIEALLYSEQNINQIDLALSGYTSDKIDSTIMGLLAPTGTPEIIDAFIQAQSQYDDALIHFENPRELELVIPGGIGSENIIRTIVDDNHSNVIHQYDSLTTELGYTRAQAIDSLYFKQGFYQDTIIMTSESLSIEMPPNAVWLLEIERPFLSLAHNTLPDGQLLFPNPNKGTFQLKYSMPFELRIYDLQGRLQFSNTYTQPNPIIQVPNLVSGVYLYQIVENQRIIYSDKFAMH